MIQTFSHNLETVKIYANGDELATLMGRDRDKIGKKVYHYDTTKRKHIATIKNPVLVSDPLAFLEQEKEYKRLITALLLLSKQKKTTEYDRFSFEFDQDKYKQVRGPNQDTLFFVDMLRTYDISQVKECIEVCAGSGFIGAYFAYLCNRQGKKDYHVTFNDILEDAERCYKDNNEIPGKTSYILGDAREALATKKHDLILCNPPYIPRKNSIEGTAYEGLELAQHILEHLDDLLTPDGKLLINLSSLSMEMITPIFEKMKEQGRDITLLKEQTVPLKVYNLLWNEERLAEIEQNPGYIHKDATDTMVHPHRHTIQGFEIKRNAKAC